MKLSNNTTFLILFYSLFTNAQISLTNVPNIDITGSSVFLDASTLFSLEAGAQNSIGKGIVIPSVDLINFEFDLTIADGITFPTYFDGMMVYNNATGSTLTTGARSSTSTNVTPGFYYFSNPNGGANGSVTAGVWTALGSGGSGGGGTKDITTTAAPTDTKVNGKQVFAINGTFTASGTSTKITVPKPTGMTGYFKFSTYSNGALFRGEIHSFDVNAVTNNVVLGNGFFSEVYPAGTYEYVLEYFTQ